MAEKLVRDVEQFSEVSIMFSSLPLIYEQALTSMQPDSPNLVDHDLEMREKALVWKQDLRIIPLCAAIYLLCYLDRSNIGLSLAP